MERFMCGVNSTLIGNGLGAWRNVVRTELGYRGKLRARRSVQVDLQALAASWRGFNQLLPVRFTTTYSGELAYDSDLNETAFEILEPYYASGDSEQGDVKTMLGSAAYEVPLACWLANANTIDPMKFLLNIGIRLPAYCTDPWHISMLVETLPSPDDRVILSREMKDDVLDAVTGEVFYEAVKEQKINRLDFVQLSDDVAGGVAPSILEASFRFGWAQDIALPRLIPAMFGPGVCRLGPEVTRRVLAALGSAAA